MISLFFATTDKIPSQCSKNNKANNKFLTKKIRDRPDLSNANPLFDCYAVNNIYQTQKKHCHINIFVFIWYTYQVHSDCVFQQ